MAPSYLDTLLLQTVTWELNRYPFSYIAVMIRNNAQYKRRAQTSHENPYATSSTSSFINIQDVTLSGIVATPSYRLDCCLMTDGASAIIVACEDLARSLTDKPVFVTGLGNGTD